MEAIRTIGRPLSRAQSTDNLVLRPQGQVPQMPTDAEIRAMGATLSRASRAHVTQSEVELPSYEIATATSPQNGHLLHPQMRLQDPVQKPSSAQRALLRTPCDDLEAQSLAVPESLENVLGVHPGIMKPLLASAAGATFATASTAGAFYIVQAAELALEGTACRLGPTMALGGLAGLLGAGAMLTGQKFDRDAVRIKRASELASKASMTLGYAGVLAASYAFGSDMTVLSAIESDRCTMNLMFSMPPLSVLPYVGAALPVGIVVGAVAGIYKGTHQIEKFWKNSRSVNDDAASA